MRLRHLSAILLSATFLTTLHWPTVLAQALPELGDPSLSALPPQQERIIARDIMRQARRDPDFYDDAEATDYIARMGARLAAKGADARQEFEFFLND